MTATHARNPDIGLPLSLLWFVCVAQKVSSMFGRHSPALARCHPHHLPPYPTPMFVAFLSPWSDSRSYWKRTRSLSICLCSVVSWHAPPRADYQIVSHSTRTARAGVQKPLTIDLQL